MEKSIENQVDVTEGLKFDQGALSRYFFTNEKTQECLMEDPLILLSEEKISNIHTILPIL